MYIWLGIDLDNQLRQLKTLRDQTRTQLGMPVDNPNFPMHISLKISFQIPDNLVEQVVQDLCGYFTTLAPFDIHVDKFECHPNISWVLYKPCQPLMDISTHLNNFLLENYNVPLHEYDTDFKYHSTLFLDGTTEQIAQGFDVIKQYSLPQKVTANTFCIGMSPNGANYTYAVTHRIVVQ